MMQDSDWMHYNEIAWGIRAVLNTYLPDDFSPKPFDVKNIYLCSYPFNLCKFIGL